MQKLTLHSILTPSVFTVTPDTPLPDVLASMEALRISCVVAIDATQRPLGIFTEQDAIRLMAKRKVVAQLRMADVMSSPPLTGTADLDFREAYQLISARGVRHLIVVDKQDKLVGVVSEADFMHHMGMEYLVELKTVSSAMTRNPLTLKEDATLADAVDLMDKHRISCVIVTRDHIPVGILTERDTVALARTVIDPTRIHIVRVMKAPVQTIAAAMPLQQAVKQMESGNIRRLVVVEGEILAGIVTRHDIVKSIQGSYIEFLHEALERQRRELRHAHQQVEETRQQLLYHSLMEQVDDAIIVSQEESGRIVDCNDQACRCLGYTRDELLQLAIFDIATTISPGASWQAERQLFARDHKRIFETRHRRHDGSQFPVEINARLIRKNDEGYIVAVARDLSSRKRAEAQLHLQNAALNSSANAIVITDKDAIILWANPAFSTMTGYALEEALGKRPKELVRSGIQPREFYEVLWNTILSGEVWRGEVVNKRKDGTLYHEEMTITPVYAEDHVITHFIAVKQDISLRKNAEQKLLASEATYRGLLNSAGDAIYVHDENGVILDINHAAEVMYGYSREEFIGKMPNFLAAPGKNDFPAIVQTTQLALSGTPQRFEFWGIRKNGEVFPKEVTLTKGNYFGRPVIVAVARDISASKAAEEKLRVSELTYRGMINSVSDAVCIRSEQGVFLDVNQAAENMYGYTREEIVGKSMEFLLAPENNDMLAIATALQLTASGSPQRLEFFGTRKNGAIIPVEVSLAKGQYFGAPAFIAVAHEISERKLVEEQLREAAAVMQNTHEGVMITDAKSCLIATNKAFTDITGYSAQEVLGKNPKILNSGRQDKTFYENMWKKLLRDGFWQGEMWNRRKSGEIYPQLLTISTIYDEQQQPMRYIGMFADITQLKENQAQLEFMAHHDPLTKLPNRSLAESRLEQELEQAHRHSQKLSVLFIDLDRFKQVNDSFGHLVGDELLCAVANKLRERLREGDTLGRLGGDEFILIASPLQEKQDAAVIARDFINALSEPFKLTNGVEVFIGCSIGISLFPSNGASVAELTKNADAAMYLAKENGRNQFSFYTPELNAGARNKLEMENDLRRAVLHSELSLHYQPKVNIRNGNICGAEALARWQKPDGQWVPPGQFIPLAEKSGVILTIGNWVFEQTCAQIREWIDSGLPEVCVAVNVSARQFRSGHLDKLLRAALEKFNIPPHLLELELTESMLMHDPENAIATMQRLKNVGVKISLDDFGTGYSNFAYLRRFPIDSLKIDQSFVHGVTTRAEDAMIVDTIINLAHRMQLDVIAEGVETAEQLAYMRANHCDELQGYYFSKALPHNEFAEMLRSKKSLYD